MEYLPEWKLYLWKKLLMNNEEFDKGDVMVVNFMFFSDSEQFTLTLQKLQRQIDGIQHTYHEALAKQRAREIAGHSNDPLVANEYFTFQPMDILGALVELMDNKPHILTITARLHKQYIEHYRKAKGTYEAQQKKKHLASLGSGRSTPYAPNPNFMNDPYCGLGKTIYEKTEVGEALTTDEFRSLTGILHGATHDCLMMNIKINKPALKAKLDAYLDDFTAGNLVAPHGVLYFSASIQSVQVYSAIQVMTQSFGPKNLLVTPERIAQATGWKPGDEKYYRIFEALFCLEKNGHIIIHNLRKSETILSVVITSETTASASASGVSPNPDDVIEIQTQHGPLSLNKRTGDFEYGSVKDNLNPTSQEYKVLLKLMTSKNCQATYSELLGGNVSKVSKMNLADTVKKLKMALGILPAATATNQDIIDNVKNLAYKLLI